MFETRAASPSDESPASAFAAALVNELATHGVREACIAPGSRSTPLALACFRHPSVRVHVHLDERSAGFFALGLAKASREPVAVVCTSGTAAANLLPAVVEADLGRVPLVVLTADRPPELQDWGAAQTIDQKHLFGRHARWFADAPVPDGTPGVFRTAAALGARAAVVAAGSPAGAVHLNLPFREPLASPPPPEDARRSGLEEPSAREWSAGPGVDPEAIALLHELSREHEHGLILCGPLDEPDAADAIADLAARIGWPVLADPASQLRCGPHAGADVLGHADLLLGTDAFSNLRPSVVLRFGAPMTSKAITRWLVAHPPEHDVRVDLPGAFRDPDHTATDYVRGSAAEVAGSLARRWFEPRKPSAFAAAFARADRIVEKTLEEALEDGAAFLAAGVARALGAALPPGEQLYAASSMAIRDLDAFLPKRVQPLRVLANRGANGIDGLVSSALGAAHAGPTTLLTGDLGFLHDASGLLRAGASQAPLVIVVLNDDGGGIFSYLPAAGIVEPEAFETLFRTPHGRDLGALCRGFGLPHARADSRGGFLEAFEAARGAGGPAVVEVSIDAEANVAEHRTLRARVARALASG